MINVLFVLPGLGSGGSERVVYDIARSLNRQEFKPIIFAIQGGELDECFKRLNIDIVISKKRENQGHLYLMMHIYRIIKKYKINIVNAHHFTSLLYSFIGVMVSRKAQLIFTEHTVQEIQYLNVFWRFLGIIILLLTNGTCIGISNEISKEYRNRYLVADKKIITIKNAIDITRFNTKNTIDVRKKLNIPENKFVIVMIANFRPQKNHKNMVSAFNIISRKYEDCILVFAGDGELENDIKTMVKDLGLSNKIYFLGSRKDIESVYMACDVFCLPSFYEGLPLSILEAMASKRPVIATNVSGIKEVVIHGKNGILVPSNNSDQLAEEIMRLIENEDERLRLAEDAYKNVISEYDIKTWINKYERLFSMKATHGKID